MSQEMAQTLSLKMALLISGGRFQASMLWEISTGMMVRKNKRLSAQKQETGVKRKTYLLIHTYII